MQVVYFFCDPMAIHIPFFDYDKRVFSLIAAQNGGIWDRSKNEFTFKRNNNDLQMERDQFKTVFSAIPTVWVETNAPPKVTGFLDRPWHKTAAELYTKSQQAKPKSSSFPTTDHEGKILPEQFSPQWQEKLEAEMRSRKLSPHTRSVYLYFNNILCRILQKPPEKISADDITHFLARMDKTGAYSASTMNLALSSFKFFYRHVIKNNITRDHYRPRQDKKLPVVFSKNEIKTMLALEKNIKHRLLLMLVYASGLRVSEAVNLKHGDLDTDRMTVSIKGGKGRKDRETRMAAEVLTLLAEYYKLYHISRDQTQWVFPSYDPSKHIAIRTAQYIFEKALKRCNIAKKASTHSLRHTYATHLLESGTDITYIKDLMGHNSIKTTERYTHVAKRKVLKIKSPLDLIDEPEE